MNWKSRKLRIAIIAMITLFVAWLCTALSHALADKYDSFAAAICALVTGYLGANVGSSFAHAKTVQPATIEEVAPPASSVVTILTGEKKD